MFSIHESLGLGPMRLGRLIPGALSLAVLGAVVANNGKAASISKPLHLVRANTNTFLGEVVSDLKARMMDFHQSLQGNDR